MNEPTHSVAPLSSLEVSGALCARVIHDLTNLVSGILGNAEYAQRADASQENLQRAIQAISASANNAGKLLGQCLPLQQFISRESFPFPALEQAVLIAESACLAPGWHVIEPTQLTGEIAVQPRWLTGAVWQLVRETEADQGEIEFNCGPAVFPVVWSGTNLSADQPRQLFQITLRYRSEQVLLPNGVAINPDRFPLLAAHELIRKFRGQIHSRSKPPGRQEISILIPLS